MVVHASPDLPPIRLCFGTAMPGAKATVAQFPALPQTPAKAFDGTARAPGIYAGTAQAMPTFPVDMSAIDIASYLLFADDQLLAGQNASNPNEALCTDLLGPDGTGSAPAVMKPGVDFLAMPAIPAGTFKDTSAYLIAITGCLPQSGSGAHDAAANAALCGADYDAVKGNVALSIVELDSTPLSAAEGFGTQVADRSQPLGGAHAPPDVAANGVRPMVAYAAGGGAFLTTDPVKFGATQLDPSPAAALFPIPNTSISGATFNLVPANAGGGFDLDAGAPVLAQTLASVATISPPGVAPLTAGETTTFVILGDPAAAPVMLNGALNPAFDGHGLHAIAFVNSFPAAALQ
jgi:hypothetical protein